MSGIVKVIPLAGKLFLFLIQASSHFSTDGFVKGFLFLGQVRRGLFRFCCFLPEAPVNENPYYQCSGYQ